MGDLDNLDIAVEQELHIVSESVITFFFPLMICCMKVTEHSPTGGK
jgi:hypothetical protein